jgi:23S rRNA (adenine2503-C2)-methyltransferase
MAGQLKHFVLWEWLWKKKGQYLDDMSDLPKAFRAALAGRCVLRPLALVEEQRSADGTVKCAFKTWDGHVVEGVLIPTPTRLTACIRSQIGCSLTCSFCATGKLKRIRNLDAQEIYDQVVLVNRQSLETFGHPLTNVVYMGMGEPLLAYRNVMDSIDRLCAPDGLNMSPRRITISTAGIAKMIRQLADDGTKCNLALSLHAADDVKRNEIMPINEHNDLASLLDAIAYFYQKTQNRISYEYIAFQHFNDSLEDAAKLARLCRRFPVRINIIEYNPIDGAPFEKASEHRINDFARFLRERGIVVTVRRSRGKDIDAACGQLANKG